MNNPSSCSLTRTYAEGYFHGVNSSYPKEGYESQHPDRKELLQWIRSVRGAGRLLDVGCAYGYLVEQSRAMGFRGFGVDVSTYALSRLTGLRQILCAGIAQTLPFKDSSFDLLFAMDVLEHLSDPENALREFCRVLRPGGWLLVSTPDPLFFQRHEPTHCAERSPAKWLQALGDLGFLVFPRFPGGMENFEAIAVKPPAAERIADLLSATFRFDYLDGEAEILKVSNARRLDVKAALRGQWSPLETKAGRKFRRLPQGGACFVYLSNQGKHPVLAKIRITFLQEPVFFAPMLDERPMKAKVKSLFGFHSKLCLRLNTGASLLKIQTDSPVTNILVSFTNGPRV